MTPAIYNLMLILLILLCIYLVLLICLSLKKHAQQKTQINPHTFLCIYASQSGQTRAYAQQTMQQLRKAKKHVLLVDIKDVTSNHLQDAHHIIWMVSTYIDGAAPESAEKFNRWLFQHEINLAHQTFMVLAFGDERYQHYCGYGEKLFNRLIDLGATSYCELLKVNNFINHDLKRCHRLLEKFTKSKLTVVELQKEWHLMTLHRQTVISKHKQHAKIYEIVFNPPKNVTWQAGDHLEIQCCNVGEELTEFKRHYPDLSESHLNDLVFKDLVKVPDKSSYPSIAEWIEQFEDLPTRVYGIVSLPMQTKLHLYIYDDGEIHTEDFGISLLTQKLKVGQNLLGHIRHNPKSALLNMDVPVIFITNSEGFAEVMTYLRQRADKNQAQNWLICDEVHNDLHQMFQPECLAWQTTGILPKIDHLSLKHTSPAYHFSRMLMQNQVQFMTWIEQGAVIYVCGRLEGMLADVNDGILTLLGETALMQLKQQQRFIMQVY